MQHTVRDFLDSTTGLRIIVVALLTIWSNKATHIPCTILHTHIYIFLMHLHYIYFNTIGLRGFTSCVEVRTDSSDANGGGEGPRSFLIFGVTSRLCCCLLFQTSMYLQMAQARGRASRAAEPSAVHETLGLKVRCGPCLHRSPAYCLGSWSPAATPSLCV